MPPDAEAPAILARTTTLEGLALALRDRRRAQGLPQLLVDEIGGLQNGYCGKIEAEALNPGRGKGLGKLTIPLMLGALGVEIALIPADASTRKQRDKNEDFWSRKSRQMAEARQRKLTPKQRRKIARAAARARWAKARKGPK